MSHTSLFIRSVHTFNCKYFFMFLFVFRLAKLLAKKRKQISISVIDKVFLDS